MAEGGLYDIPLDGSDPFDSDGSANEIKHATWQASQAELSYVSCVNAAMRTLQYRTREGAPLIPQPSPITGHRLYRCGRDIDGFVLRGTIKCPDVERLLLMERDYCWLDRRRKWDNEAFHSVQQFQEFDCGGRGILRAIEYTRHPPPARWPHEKLKARPITSFRGIQWDRYDRVRSSVVYLFQSVPLPTVPIEVDGVSGQCFYAFHAIQSSERTCYVTIAYSFSEMGKQAKLHYETITRERLRLYEHVSQNWSHYYPDNGRVIR